MKTLQYFTPVLTIVALLFVIGCGSTASRQGTGEYFDDSVITAKVKTAIFNDPQLKSLEISVETFRGVVQLSGFVESQASIQKAGTLAKGAQGVKSVDNNLSVKY
ncbi:BON domain-containing protein [Photobacterium halotolerans]|uniref:BON domain-containing protein n=1 Tax=Photobacterium halotolerans TaxID=265726 RepID=UPI001372F1D6|nr:BON domain-containing protein [Photobacterium halotolerans]NAX46743.1 BON domain-containing protein [Photobacterium halotolerans]